MKFSDFPLHDSVKDSLSMMGFEKPTPIQEEAIPLIIEGHDMIACAQTGTGKTAAYLLPIISKLAEASTDHVSVNTLIICPTRELAVQIDQQLQGFSYMSGVSSIAIYGGGDGSDFDTQKKALSHGADVIIATPGKLISHLNMGYVKLDNLQHLILDEADRMLDMGFHDDIMRIIHFLPKKRQTLMFSATMPSKIRTLTEKLLNNPKEISIAISKPNEGIFQAAFLVYDYQKVALAEHLLTSKELPSVVIFCGTKQYVKELEIALKKRKINAEAIHSDLEQTAREDVLRRFKNRQTNVLVATDIVSRGIDVEGISLVINFDVPKDPEDYIHRIGRTARASTKGVAFTFINEKDQFNFKRIEDLIGREIVKPPIPEALGEGPLYEPQKNKGKFPGRKPAFKKRKA
ncbi:DEAD/DEAH box helicase [Cytophagales bacterium LB-30]|uniref:DEAD/DEAH box helicase n=1 Tax=Shiella aurantiaca TaxID=3058365 RepID=A0ABT8F166_9BACT|nr:DEAD/DEAH box helicase [Shiella aurantiaca]MDN4163976.1 DEAD/DEAH box helicase [Shiella aurantiaca]